MARINGIGLGFSVRNQSSAPFSTEWLPNKTSTGWAGTIGSKRFPVKPLVVPFNEFITESIAASDSLAVSATLNNLLTEILTFLDTEVPSLSISRVFVESLAASDNLGVSATYNNSVAESSALSDALGFQVQFNNSITESVAASDTLAQTVIFNAVILENLAVGEGFPDPSDVVIGVMYGPTGVEFTGKLRFILNADTGEYVLVLNRNTALNL
jgi:hypothetical protein